MADLKEYKCPCCGGGIHFDIGIQKLKCPYCETEFEIEAIEAIKDEEDSQTDDIFTWETTAGSQWEEDDGNNLKSYECRSCGAQIMADATLASSKCPYCDNPIVMTDRFDKGLKPDYVIPFKLDKAYAMKRYEEHMKKKFFLPKVFKDQNHIDEIRGLYVPVWLFDTDAKAEIDYRGTRIRHWSDSKYNYTETSFYSIHRGGEIGFETIPVDGSTKMPDDLMESIEPFDFNEAVPFQTAYLAGYLSDRYDVDADESIDRANYRVKCTAEDAFRNTVYGYDTVTVQNSNIELQKGSVKYAMYPVWILNTTWNGEHYLFAMNGQTGKFVGNLPKDKSKATGTFAAVTIGVTAIAFLVQFLINLL